MDKLDTKSALDLAAAVIVNLSANERAGWILYVLETVDGVCSERGDETFSDSIVTVFLALSHRLVDGNGAW